MKNSAKIESVIVGIFDTAFEVSKGDQACPVNEILLLR